MNDKFYSTLSLSMRAKKLVYGFDTVNENAKAKNVFLLLTASDLSPKTAKEVLFIANKENIPHLYLEKTMDDLENLIGKKTGVLGITDHGFAQNLIQNKTEESNI